MIFDGSYESELKMVDQNIKNVETLLTNCQKKKKKKKKLSHKSSSNL